MNRKRGRRPGKVYPQPDNIFEGAWNAHWGKIGTSEAMLIAMFCPYRLWGPHKRSLREKEALKGLPRAPWSKKLLKQLGRHLKKWDCEIGPFIGRKIASGDYQFFHQLGAAVEELAKEERQAHSPEPIIRARVQASLPYRGPTLHEKGTGEFLSPAWPPDRFQHSLKNVPLGTVSQVAQMARDPGLLLGPKRRLEITI